MFLLDSPHKYHLDNHISTCWLFLEEIKENPPFKAKGIISEGWKFNNEATCPPAALEEFKYTKSKTPSKNASYLSSNDIL